MNRIKLFFSIRGIKSTPFCLLILLGYLSSGCSDEIYRTAFETGLQELSPDDRYIVVFHETFEPDSIRKENMEIIRYLYPQNAVAARIPDYELDNLVRNPRIKYIEPDHRRYLLTQMVSYGIPLIQADQLSDDQAGVIKICVVDSGYDRGHEDLPFATVTGTNDPGTGNWWNDGHGHGTSVTGVIAALDNDIGMLGVLPGYTVAIHIVKALNDSGSWTYSSGLIGAANTCENNGANIINWSLGGTGQNQTERQAFQNIYNRGILNIAAAGNSGATGHFYPASYESVVSVAAVDRNMERGNFSQINNQVELSAPGVAIRSTKPFNAGLEYYLQAGDDLFRSDALEYSPVSSGTGPLVDCGHALSPCQGASNAVCLISRGTNSYADKVLNCEAGGGVAAIIYNNRSGRLEGSLKGAVTSIPALGIEQHDGNELLGRTGETATVYIAPGYYSINSGTSLAAPYVTGAAALIWSRDTSWTNAEIREALQVTAIDLGTPGRNSEYGYGLIQVADALAWLAPIPKVEKPVFSPNPSIIYISPQEVNISSPTPGAEIRYTLDSSLPDESSDVFSGPIMLENQTETTIRAKAYLEGWEASDTATAVYRITGTVTPPVFTPSPGIFYEEQQVVIHSDTPGTFIHYTLDGREPDISSPLYDNPVSVEMNTELTIRARAFRDDWEPSQTVSGTFRVMDKVAPPVFSPEPGHSYTPLTVTLQTETPAAVMHYTLDGSEPSRSDPVYFEPFSIGEDSHLDICAKAFLNDRFPSDTVCASYSVTGESAAPVFDPPPGDYAASVIVSISTSTESAVIRYTLDGSEPDLFSSLYSEPLEIQPGENLIKARAFREYWKNSPVSEAAYNVFSNISIEDSKGNPADDIILEPGENFLFKVVGGSGLYRVEADMPRGLESPVIEEQDSYHLYTAPSKGAFAGLRRIKAVDIRTGSEASFSVRTPLSVIADPAKVSTEGDRIEVLVSGGRAGTLFNYELSVFGEQLPLSIGSIVRNSPATENHASGNPGKAIFEIEKALEKTEFSFRASNYGMEGISNLVTLDPSLTVDEKPPITSGHLDCNCTSGAKTGILSLFMLIFFPFFRRLSSSFTRSVHGQRL